MNLKVELAHILDVGIKEWKNWDSLRKEVIRCYPECSICGQTKKLEVHHIVPRHIAPEKALLFDNLIVLDRDCHFHIGHWNNFKDSNPHIVEIAEFSKSKWEEK